MLMTRELLLLRHGKSDWHADSDDLRRPLKDRGKRGAQRIGLWLQQQGLVPDHVLSSPAERARVTAEKCCKAMGLTAQDVHLDPRLYLATPDTLLAVLADCPANPQRVMLVGHNPGLEQLLRLLVATPIDTPADGKLLPTATLARLSMPDDWHQLLAGSASLLALVRARDLPKKFNFPAPHGAELRERPSYYYTQSSVIPYRIRDGRMEILLVRSSTGKHWVVPKGIVEPGHSLQSSAANEAREEAGVEGVVENTPLGSYRYPKWGATCTVTVFPMQVTRVLDEGEWEEQHRGRQWVSAAAAAGLLKQPELAPLVLALEQQLRGD